MLSILDEIMGDEEEVKEWIPTKDNLL
jgi:hypothetical protein